MVYYFLEGGAFMWPILLTLLFGLAFVIERAYSLMMSAVDSQTFFESVSQSIKENGTDAAVQVCSETEGPVASELLFSALHQPVELAEITLVSEIEREGHRRITFTEMDFPGLLAMIRLPICVSDFDFGELSTSRLALILTKVHQFSKFKVRLHSVFTKQFEF